MDGTGQPSSGGVPSRRGGELERMMAALCAHTTALPELLDAVPLATAPALLAVLRTVTRALHEAEGHLALRVFAQAAVPPARSPATFISMAEAARRLGRSTRWLYRHKHRLPFVRRDGSRGLRASVPDLEQYMRTRPTLAK